MKLIHVLKIPDILSLMNAIFGFSAMVLAFNGKPILSVMFILMAAVWDGMDGFLARRYSPSPIGANLDSLADLISFGLAPAAISWSMFRPSRVIFLLGCFYMVCGMLRLARFNISPREWSSFEGIPITAAGVMLAVSFILASPLLTAVIMLFLSVLMISSLPYPKVRDPKAVPAIFLATLMAVLISNYTGDLRHAGMILLLFLVSYLISPVVIKFRRTER